MYGKARRVAGRTVMEFYGAAHYADCDEALIVIDGELLRDAETIASKLGVRIRYLKRPWVRYRTAASISKLVHSGESGETTLFRWLARSLCGQTASRTRF